jgi:hypothetical protein
MQVKAILSLSVEKQFNAHLIQANFLDDCTYLTREHGEIPMFPKCRIMETYEVT